MKREPSKSAIFWRFGIIGLWLYKILHVKPQWLEKRYIFTRFMITFFIFFTFLFIFIFPWFTEDVIHNARLVSRLVIVGIVLLASIGYGYWAETFFKETKSAESNG